MLRVLAISASIFFCFRSEAQEPNLDKRVHYSVFAGVGRSTFVSDPAAPSKFPTLEVRLGAGLIKPIGNNIELRSRLAFGVKFKREPFNEPGQPYVIGPPFMGLDELASNRNHYFFEIPLMVQFNLPHPKLGFSLGGNYRHFLPHNESVDFLTNRREIGIILGASYRLNNRLDVGLDYYFGLSKIYSSSGLIDNQEFTLDAYNQFGQIRFEYYLTRNKVR